jgi:folate-binding protein YgfZ
MGADDNEPMNSNDRLPGTTTGAARLADWGLILARGPDAASFLHSQLTQDVQGLMPDQARLAGYCSAKGRLLATFVLCKPEAETVALACSADLLAATAKRLSMFVLRAKCKLADASAEFSLWGLVGSAAAAWLGETAAAAPVWRAGRRGPAHWIRLPDAQGLARWLLVQPAGEGPPELPPLAASTWQWLEVHSGIARITAATAEHFVPQMVNLELVGGVNFQKGCYPGQEVVARSQYRGTLKRRMLLAAADGPLAAGSEIRHSADPEQPAGEVVLAAPGPDGRWAALVELKMALLDTAGGFSAEGLALSTSAPPYPIPVEAA